MLKKLRQLLADTRAKAEAINKLAVSENRTLTDTEQTEFDALIAESEKLKKQIVSQEALLEIERNAPAASSAIEVGADHATERPWGSLAEQLMAVRNHARSRGTQTDPRLRAAALGANESVDSEGGFLVAPEFAPGVWQRAYEASDLASRCFDQPMTASNRLLVNAVDEDSRVDGSRWGGVQSYWLGEAGTFTPSQAKFRQMELIAKKLIVLSYATEEQLADGPALAAYLDKVVPLEFAFKIDDAIYNGTGAGMPLGFLLSGALLTIAKDSGDSSATVSSNDVFNMWGRTWPSSRKNGAWFINVDVEKSLWNLTRGSGTAVELLYTGPGERGNNNNYGVMMGRPVIPVEYAATLGTPGDIVFADLSQYYLARRSGVQMDTSIHVQFLTDQQAFRWKARLDGQPAWKKPLTPKNGSNTLSPFVALATRP
ncbi:MAG: phage major capsid protein [Acidobacteria bacterium]|nr:phage major capsid protein [Acidobacteriota bacterium]